MIKIKLFNLRLKLFQNQLSVIRAINLFGLLNNIKFSFNALLILQNLKFIRSIFNLLIFITAWPQSIFHLLSLLFETLSRWLQHCLLHFALLKELS
jgi:hypothetical protein